MHPLFKIKRAILVCCPDFDPPRIVISKPQKKVFMIMGSDLKFVAEMKSRRRIVWADDIDLKIKDTYKDLVE